MDTKKIPIKKVVLDILKPHKPDIATFGQTVCAEKSVKRLNVSVYAVDEKTESIKATLEGPAINFEQIKIIISNFGAVIHSIDSVIVGKGGFAA